MKRMLLQVMVLVIIISMIAVFSFTGCKAASEETATTTEEAPATEEEATEEETEEVAEEEKEPVNLVFWWWGEQEAPGLEGWLAETVELYQDENPNVTIETVLQSTETLISAFKSAAAAQEGPDLQYFWGGIFTIEDAWENNIVPVSDYIPEDELSHYFTSYEQEYGGKIWGSVWYVVQNPVVYNKTIFNEVGLDPENPPATWDEFLDACKKIKDEGYIPLSLGGKEGFAGAWLASYIGIQNMDNIADLMAPAVGDAKYTDPKYSEWWYKLAELRDNGYINDDYNSIEFYQGQDMFANEKSAMTLTVSSGAVEFVKTLGEDVVGITSFPVWGSGDYAGTLQVSSQTVGITSWSQYKEESADFIMFIHSPERTSAMYEQSGAYPADDRFDTSLLETSQEKQMAELMKGKTAPWGENYIPPQFDEEAYYFGVQDFFNGISPEEMAKNCQEYIEKWQVQQPDALESFKEWYESLK